VTNKPSVGADNPSAVVGGTDDATWFVVRAGQVRRMSLDELDAAFALEQIDGSTPVWTRGMAGWERLAVVADLDAEPSLSESEQHGPTTSEASKELRDRGRMRASWSVLLELARLRPAPESAEDQNSDAVAADVDPASGAPAQSRRYRPVRVVLAAAVPLLILAGALALRPDPARLVADVAAVEQTAMAARASAAPVIGKGRPMPSDPATNGILAPEASAQSETQMPASTEWTETFRGGALPGKRFEREVSRRERKAMPRATKRAKHDSRSRRRAFLPRKARRQSKSDERQAK
jgi:hypothetical protein